MSTVIVTGARNQIAYFLLPKLVMANIAVYAISRQPVNKTNTVTWLQRDLAADTILNTKADILYHLAPLKLAIPLLKSQTDIKQVIAFSSTSRFSKIQSSQNHERDTVAYLINGEKTLINYCEQHNIKWTILRPTLIYGCGLDKNIYLVSTFIQKFKCFPIAYPAAGLRQPVHADDLAKACLQVTKNPRCYQQSYQLSGAETLSYKQMIQRVFMGLNQSSCFIPLPLGLFKIFYQLSCYLPFLKRFKNQLNPAMLERMNQDLCFSHIKASTDFNYKPRKFYPDILSLK